MLTHDEDRCRRDRRRARPHQPRAPRHRARGAGRAPRRPWGSCPREQADAAGLVVAGEGWHPGVVGICASRLVERTGRPVVLVAVDEIGTRARLGPQRPRLRPARGAARLRRPPAALRRPSRRGRAGARGRAASPPFARRSRRTPARRWATAPRSGPRRSTPSSAPTSWASTSPGSSQRLAPFGKGNPPVRLIVPGARVRDVRPMGEGERHARFSLEGASARARGVAFGVNGIARDRGRGRSRWTSR